MDHRRVSSTLTMKTMQLGGMKVQDAAEFDDRLWRFLDAMPGRYG
jgi:hypothetical protein